MTVEQIKQIVADPRAFLSQGKNAKTLIAAKRERIDFWRKLAESITVMLKPDGGGAPGGYKQSLVENAVCNILDLENEIVVEIGVLTDIEKAIKYSLQGTTQGRYLTGGVPPVRFSM